MSIGSFGTTLIESGPKQAVYVIFPLAQKEYQTLMQAMCKSSDVVYKPFIELAIDRPWGAGFAKDLASLDRQNNVSMHFLLGDIFSKVSTKIPLTRNRFQAYCPCFWIGHPTQVGYINVLNLGPEDA